MKEILVFAGALALVLGLGSGASDSPSVAAPVNPPSAPDDLSAATEDPSMGESRPMGAEKINFCPRYKGCEVEPGCRRDVGSCVLTFDTGENSCRLAPGVTFDCPPNETVHVETCDCLGIGCSLSTGTYLTCA